MSYFFGDSFCWFFHLRYYSWFARNKLEREIEVELHDLMVDDEYSEKEIVEIINGKLGYDMYYCDEDGEMNRWWDRENIDYQTPDNKPEEDYGDRPPLPFAHEMTYREFATRYRFDKKEWKRYKTIARRNSRLYNAYPGNDYFYLRILLRNRVGVRDVDDLLLGPEGNMRYPNYKLACLAWDFIDNSAEYFTAMHESYLMGWKGDRLLRFFGNIVCEGDATNIEEIWNGPKDPSLQNLTDEERIYPNGMKHLMITVPKTKRDQGYPPSWKKIRNDRVKDELQQQTLKRLAFILERNGKDYPEELPTLQENTMEDLRQEWESAHKVNRDFARQQYDHHHQSTILIQTS